MSNEPHFKKRVGRNVFDNLPKVSVVIPAYNCVKTIEETLSSALTQKFREHEIIVINDGSPDTDRLERVIRNYLEDIVYIRQRNSGAGVARNLGIEHARGNLIAFLDADDVWMPEYLASQFVFMQRHDYDMVYCDAQLFGLNSAYRRTFMEDAPSVGEANFDSILEQRCNVITSGTIVKKKLLFEAGMFEKERVRAHDFHLWLRIAKLGAKIGYQEKVLLKHRLGTDGISGDSVSRVEREIDALERVRRTIELNDEQQQIVTGRIAGLEADLAVEQGKSYLLSGEYREAAIAFRVANRHRRSTKLAAISWLARIAPSTLLKHYKTHRSAEIPLVRTR